MPADGCAIERECPDIVFSDGSTRTVEGMLACANVIETYSCEQWRLGFRPDCITPGELQAGESCLFHSQCASLICDGPPASGTCPTCVDPIPQGESCAGSDLACAAGLECGAGALCTPILPQTVTEYVEPEPLPEGAPCTANGNCERPLTCADPDADGNGTCAATGAVDQPCTLGIAMSKLCEFDSYCDADDVCRAYPKEGEPCVELSPGPLSCASGLACDPQTGLCAPGLAPGAACTSLGQCAEGTCSSPSNLFNNCLADPAFAPEVQTDYTDCVCSRYQSEGEPCIPNADECDQGTECQDGVCTALESLGLFAEMCGPAN
jgi:hypothetical protein